MLFCSWYFWFSLGTGSPPDSGSGYSDPPEQKQDHRHQLQSSMEEEDEGDEEEMKLDDIEDQHDKNQQV